MRAHSQKSQAAPSILVSTGYSTESACGLTSAGQNPIVDDRGLSGRFQRLHQAEALIHTKQGPISGMHRRPTGSYPDGLGGDQWQSPLKPT
jgi:hypothetical protein